MSFDVGPPTIARLCGSLPSFLIWNVTFPALSDGEASAILNSVSVTLTVVGFAAGGGADCFVVCAFVVVCPGELVAGAVVAVVEVAAVVVVARTNVSAACSLSFVSFGSAPNTSTAVSIPKKKTTATTMKAGSPRPGERGRRRGNKNDDASANTMNANATRARPTLWPVERARTS